jgi:hypothetical protein
MSSNLETRRNNADIKINYLKQFYFQKMLHVSAYKNSISYPFIRNTERKVRSEVNISIMEIMVSVYST